MSYDGGKAGSGVYQALINLMPRHELYIEPFLGAGAVMRRKRPARSSIGIESDAAALKLWTGEEVPSLSLVKADALGWLRDLALIEISSPKMASPAGSRSRRQSSLATAIRADPSKTLIYCDPPYVISSRLSQRRIYNHELTDAEHEELLVILRALPCMVMISGYRSRLYDQALQGWRTSSYLATTRGRQVCEWVWMNFSAPRELHDYRFLGNDFRERERIKRVQRRWRAKLENMPALERLALMAVLQEL